MKQVPSYGKIMTIGSYRTENALKGVVTIQEKVDGSFFAFGVNEDGELVCRSKNNHINMEFPEQMFKLAVDNIKEIKANGLPGEIYFYAEYLNKPKHNVLKYDNVPNKNLALFDVYLNGKYLPYEEVLRWGSIMGTSVVPLLYWGDGMTYDKLANFLETDSFLGGEKVEGVVIKNYAETITLGGQVMPLITKYVRPDFKERNGTEWKEKKGFNLTEYVASFCSEARWQKALQHLKESGILVGEPKDIGAICKEVQRDLEEEEKENIKEELYERVKKDLQRVSVRGVAEWYKSLLVSSTVKE